MDRVLSMFMRILIGIIGIIATLLAMREKMWIGAICFVVVMGITEIIDVLLRIEEKQ